MPNNVPDFPAEYDAGPVDRTVDLGSTPPTKTQASPWLFVVYGSDRSRFIPVKEVPITLGRGSEAGVVLRDEGMSKVHCTVRLVDGAVEVTDNGSRNGTFIDGERIEKAVLKPNSELHIGKSVLRLEMKDEAQVKFEEEMFRAATTDPLTGVANRRSFLERAGVHIARSQRAGVPAAVFIDVDHFKKVNDTHGHAAGDAVLKEVARRVDAARRSEDLLCRYGGEEFVLLLAVSDLEQAAGFCERMRASIESSPVGVGDKKIAVTASLGVSVLRTGDTLDALLQRADEAMYRAKEKGRNRVERGE